jgi:hypothetical protein
MDEPNLTFGENPNWENNAELQKLNEKMDKLIDAVNRLQSWLVKIEMNTKASGFRP